MNTIINNKTAMTKLVDVMLSRAEDTLNYMKSRAVNENERLNNVTKTFEKYDGIMYCDDGSVYGLKEGSIYKPPFVQPNVGGTLTLHNFTAGFTLNTKDYSLDDAIELHNLEALVNPRTKLIISYIKF